MKHLDLFSGVGGFSLGMERAGFETVAFCEIDKDCRTILNKHWPGVPIYEDISNDNEYPEADVITGGFPCQDISVGHTWREAKGLSGERSGLWWQFARVIKECKPSMAEIIGHAIMRAQ